MNKRFGRIPWIIKKKQNSRYPFIYMYISCIYKQIRFYCIVMVLVHDKVFKISHPYQLSSFLLFIFKIFTYHIIRKIQRELIYEKLKRSKLEL